MSSEPLCCVRFEPHGKSVLVPHGTLLTEAAAKVGLALEQSCGGRGQCGRCRVIVRQPVVEPSLADRNHFVAEELDEGWRLACQLQVRCDLVVEIPLRSLAFSRAQILADYLRVSGLPGDPPVRKVLVNVGEVGGEEDTPLLAELERQLGQVRVSLPALRMLPTVLSKEIGQWTAVVEFPDSGPNKVTSAKSITESRHWSGGQDQGQGDLPNQEGSVTAQLPLLIEFESGDTRGRQFAVGFDIGTTTLVASLVKLPEGSQLAAACEVNPQIAFGEDVISRIDFCRKQQDGTLRLHQAVIEACRSLGMKVCRQAGVQPKEVRLCAFAGNTTMLHLLVGVNPASLGQAPFRPVFQRELVSTSAELGLPFHPGGQVYILPSIGPFVGGDTVGGLLALRLWDRPSPALLVDIGTNGEIVLSHQGKLYATATAAGPAFEGTRIRCGMRAIVGAVERVTLVDGQIQWQTIGSGKPAGICGSGLVDLLAELRRSGIVARSGRMLAPSEAAGLLPPPLADRLLLVDGRPAFEVVSGGMSASGQPIVLTQADVRQLQLAAGAIRAGVNILCQHLGVQADELREVWVAGAFGSYLRPENAQAIGLLPPEIPTERIRFAGNTSLAGAVLTAASLAERRLARWLARVTCHLELAALPEFRQAFADGMLFPELIGGHASGGQSCAAG